jgi:TolB-like protein
MKDLSAVSSQEPSGQPPEVLLDSWKEIASYVKRDVSTVQRWEKREGMPVHRHLHERRGSVYANSSELDAWLQSRKLHLEEEEREHRAETSEEAETEHHPKERPQARRWLVLCGIAVLALMAVTYVTIKSRTGRATLPKIKSLAVLPLRNLSGDPTQDYFADGMTEEVIGRLSMIRGLRVISHTSVTRYKDTRTSVPEIAKTLGVDAIVEGSVVREGNRIRVHAQLIRCATDEHFWSETYDRELGDALALESDVAQAIAARVEVPVSGAERARLIAARPVNSLRHRRTFLVRDLRPRTRGRARPGERRGTSYCRKSGGLGQRRRTRQTDSRTPSLAGGL